MTARMDFRDNTAAEAREIIKDAWVSGQSSTRVISAALAHKTWLMLTKDATEAEVRDWHVLCVAVSAAIKDSDSTAAIRIGTLCDLLRESVAHKVIFG